MPVNGSKLTLAQVKQDGRERNTRTTQCKIELIDHVEPYDQATTFVGWFLISQTQTPSHHGHQCSASKVEGETEIAAITGPIIDQHAVFRQVSGKGLYADMSAPEMGNKMTKKSVEVLRTLHWCTVLAVWDIYRLGNVL